MSFVKTVRTKYRVVSMQAVLFKDMLAKVKLAYPDIMLKFPQPPTYVWNPKDGGPETDNAAELKPQEIQDKLKVKFPDLKWVPRTIDGALIATIIFEDNSSAEFAIGAEANHLTLIYYDTTT